jgi:hypothetical protein
MAAIGCGISHKDTKHTDKCSNNRTKTAQKLLDKSTDKYFFFQNTVKITQKFDIDYIHILYKVHTVSSKKKKDLLHTS